MKPIVKKYIEMTEEQYKYKIGSYEWNKLDIKISDYAAANFEIKDWEIVLDFYEFTDEINYKGSALDLVDKWERLRILK